MQCIITGCALLADAGWISGDLHQEGEVYVFVGNVNSEGHARWFYDGSVPFYTRRMRPDDFFERRGVFVFPKSRANLNREALAYIGEAT
jgi:hypothetical protein